MNVNDYRYYANYSYLAHHGILGQKWGKRNGPPYPLKGGDYSPEEKKHLGESIHLTRMSKKRYEDKIISTGTKLATLSYDPERTKDVDMFYAAYKFHDKHEYNALFNKKIKKTIYDENGNDVGTGEFYKYRIENTAKNDIKVASENTGTNVFKEMYKNDRDFYNFVKDENRMQKYFVDDKYKFKGYQETRDSLNKLRSGEQMTESDVNKLYRMFNYVIPYDGAGSDNRGAKDVATQRAKFFNKLKEQGYSACLDTNDAMYGGFKAEAPVIVFDPTNVVLTDAKLTSGAGKAASIAVMAGKKALNAVTL